MNQRDFGLLLAELRKEHRDETMRFWSQQRLAAEANLSVDVVANIEANRKRHLPPEVLLKLARALNLTSEERSEFFLAANGVEAEDIMRTPDDPQHTLDTLMQTLQSTCLPAFIVDTYSDVIAANKSVIQFFALTNEDLHYLANHPIGTNMLTIVFSPEINQLGLMERGLWEEYAYANILFFRATSLRFRTTAYFRNLLQELYKFPLFRRFWDVVSYEQRDYTVNTEYVILDNPVLGPLQSYSVSFKTLTSYGNLFLMVYVPLDPVTSDIFATLAREGGREIVPFGSWPTEG